MKKSNLYAFIVLVALTLLTATANQNWIVILAMIGKFGCIAWFFMDIKDAHPFYKVLGAVYITTLSLIFAFAI